MGDRQIVCYTSIFVNKLEATSGGVIVEASNGGPNGPPFARFKVETRLARNLVIGKRFSLEIREEA